MSIYSGFATRKQEELYNSFVLQLIKELCDRIIKPITDIDTESHFKRVVFSIIKKMQIMEENKYLPPKLTDSTRQLCDHYQLLVLPTPNRDRESESTRRYRDKTQPIIPSQSKHSVLNYKELSTSRDSDNKFKLKQILETQRKLSSDNNQVLKHCYKLPQIQKEDRKKQNPVKVSVSMQDCYTYQLAENKNLSPYSLVYQSISTKSKRNTESKKHYYQTIDQSIIDEEVPKKKKTRRQKKYTIDHNMIQYKIDKGAILTSARQSPNPNDRFTVMRKTFISIDHEGMLKFNNQKSMTSETYHSGKIEEVESTKKNSDKDNQRIQKTDNIQLNENSQSQYSG